MHLHSPKDHRNTPTKIRITQHGITPIPYTTRIHKRRRMSITHHRNTRRHKETKSKQKTIPTSRTPLHRLQTSLRLSRPQNTERKNPSLPTLQRKVVLGSQLVLTQM